MRDNLNDYLERGRAMPEFLQRAPLVLAVIGCEAWFLWPKDNWSPDPGALVAFLLAIVALVAFELTRINPSLSVHDNSVLEELEQDLPDTVMVFLRTFDFGGAFRESDVNPVHEFARKWDRRPSLVFSNKSLQTLQNDLTKKARTLSMKLAEHTHPLSSTSPADVRSGDYFMRVFPNHNEDSLYSAEDEKLFRQRYTELNDLADEVFSSYEKLIKEAVSRRRTPKAHDREAG